MGILAPENRIRMTRSNRILWNTVTGEMVAEIEDANDNRSVTYCWRDDVSFLESDVKDEIRDRVILAKVRNVTTSAFREDRGVPVVIAAEPIELER